MIWCKLNKEKEDVWYDVDFIFNNRKEIYVSLDIFKKISFFFHT